MMEYNIQYRFVYGNMFEMQRRILNIFIHRPYEFFLSVDSGEVIRIINGDTAGVFSLLLTLLSLFTEIVVSAMLVVSIFVITPVVTICIAVLLIILLIFIYTVVKPVLRNAGLEQQKSSAGMNKWLLQSIHGIKEIKVMRKEHFFQDNYDKNGRIYIKSLRKSQTLGIVPRFLIEGICMGVMFIVVAVLIYKGANLEEVIPMLTAVAMAAIRLLPSVNRVSAAMSSVAYGEPMLDKVIENLQALNGDDIFPSDTAENDIYIKNRKIPDFCNNINFSRISYHYPDSSSNVLSEASMVIRKGESVGIVGASGAGKTTSVDIILGLLHPQKGQVLIDGFDIKNNMAGWLNQIGYIPQTIFMLDDSIRANVAFGEPKENISDEDVWRALKESALDEFVKNLPEGIETQIGERGMRLSGGQRQRIGIARALYRNPEVLIFDEATSALDNDTEAAIMESIHSLHGKRTMIIIAHRLTTIEACDHIYRAENEKLVLER